MELDMDSYFEQYNGACVHTNDMVTPSDTGNRVISLYSAYSFLEDKMIDDVPLNVALFFLSLISVRHKGGNLHTPRDTL
jgi:hypothetical protein